jgi:hypothetical protein
MAVVLPFSLTVGSLCGGCHGLETAIEGSLSVASDVERRLNYLVLRTAKQQGASLAVRLVRESERVNNRPD